MTMIIHTAPNHTVTVVALRGRFDAHTAPILSRWIGENTPARLVINLAEVSFVDSTALATMVQALKRCREADGDLRLCALQQPVRIIFELTRLDRAFTIVATEDEAIASLLCPDREPAHGR
jgi:anti-sigma B factor antagonist